MCIARKERGKTSFEFPWDHFIRAAKICFPTTVEKKNRLSGWKYASEAVWRDAES